MVKHKIMQVMVDLDATKPLTEKVETNDTYFGDEHLDYKRGRAAAGETPFVATVDITLEGEPVRLKLSRLVSSAACLLPASASGPFSPAATTSCLPKASSRSRH